MLIWCWQEREQGKASSYCGSVCGQKIILEWQQDYYVGEWIHPRRLNDHQPFASCRILWLDTFALLCFVFCFGFKSLFYRTQLYLILQWLIFMHKIASVRISDLLLLFADALILKRYFLFFFYFVFPDWLANWAEIRPPTKFLFVESPHWFHQKRSLHWVPFVLFCGHWSSNMPLYLKRVPKA